MAELLNLEIAQRLREVSRILQEQGANLFRVRAYEHAADMLERFSKPVASIVEEQGIEGLKKIPGIGESLARSIQALVETGRLPMLDRLRGELDPLTLLCSVPGIGMALAQRIHDDLAIETLEELEIAAHDGRLATYEGIGKKKLAGIIDSLAGRLGRVRDWSRSGSEPTTRSEPSIQELLAIDREYRQKCEECTLRLIAPRRFNPTHETWLPVLHTERGERHYTALYSNSPLAHQLGKTQDWVILYYDGAQGEGQYTVITAEKGLLSGQRIVRGRESECILHYKDPQVTRKQAEATP